MVCMCRSTLYQRRPAGFCGGSCGRPLVAVWTSGVEGWRCSAACGRVSTGAPVCSIADCTLRFPPRPRRLRLRSVLGCAEGELVGELSLATGVFSTAETALVAGGETFRGADSATTGSAGAGSTAAGVDSDVTSLVVEPPASDFPLVVALPAAPLADLPPDARLRLLFGFSGVACLRSAAGSSALDVCRAAASSFAATARAAVAGAVFVGSATDASRSTVACCAATSFEVASFAAVFAAALARLALLRPGRALVGSRSSDGSLLATGFFLLRDGLALVVFSSASTLLAAGALDAAVASVPASGVTSAPVLSAGALFFDFLLFTISLYCFLAAANGRDANATQWCLSCKCTIHPCSENPRPNQGRQSRWFLLAPGTRL